MFLFDDRSVLYQNVAFYDSLGKIFDGPNTTLFELTFYFVPICRAALLATQALPTVSKGDAYQQLEWVLLDAHTMLLDSLAAAGKDKALIAQRCQRLSALIDIATIPQNMTLLELQERVSCRFAQDKSFMFKR